MIADWRGGIEVGGTSMQIRGAKASQESLLQSVVAWGIRQATKSLYCQLPILFQNVFSSRGVSVSMDRVVSLRIHRRIIGT